ncbi:MAG: TlpA family protein disulfide reductase [Thermoanaerobaculia bacterium]
MTGRVLLFLFLSSTTVLAAPISFAARAHEDRIAPDFTLPTDKSTLSLSELRGKVVYVDFWASWCGPCRQSFPWMSSMSEKYAADGLVVVAINLDKDHDAATLFVEKYPVPFPVLFDPAGKTAEEFRVQAMPSSFIVSRAGRIVYAHEGFEQSKAQSLEDRIKEALSK